MLQYIEAKKRMLHERDINLNFMIDCLQIYKTTKEEVWLDTAKMLGLITQQTKKDLENNNYTRYYSFLDDVKAPFGGGA